MKKPLLCALPLLLIAACTTIDPNEKSVKEEENPLSMPAMPAASNSPYNFDSPSKVFPMPPALREISGLAVIDESSVACIQDEEGSIFILNLETEEIDKKIVFAGKGDFEEVELVGSDAYVLESSGSVFHIADYMSEGSAKATVIQTDLKKENDAEGMCYDKENQRLLISCKGKGEEKEKNKKAIYSFDLKTQKISKEPVIRLTQGEIKKAITRANPERSAKNIERAMKSDNIDELFAPSGLAVHPHSGELYVLSTQNNLIAVMDMQGNVNEVYPLTHELFTQPEGIAFAPNGDLYISNEGQKGMGNILKFTYEKK
jgi:uncharacterized protein YjiK